MGKKKIKNNDIQTPPGRQNPEVKIRTSKDLQPTTMTAVFSGPIPKENRQRHLHTGFRRSLFQAYVLPAMQHGAAFLDDASVRRLEKQFIGVDVCLAGRQAPQARLRTSRRPRQTCLAVFVQLTRMVLTVVWQAAYFAMPRIVQRHGRSKFVASCVFLTFLCQMLSVLVLAVCIDQCYGISAKNTLHVPTLT